MTALPAVPGAAAAPRRVLFATGTGARMYRAQVRTLLRRLGQTAGLPASLAASLSPHSMRHAFATLNLDADASLRDLQDAMGTLPRAPSAATTAAAATWTAPPATCSPA
jgi:site-specific recombinase XerD